MSTAKTYTICNFSVSPARIRTTVVAIATMIYYFGCLSTAMAEANAPSDKEDGVVQPVPNEDSITMFGQSFPSKPGNTTFPEALKAVAPKDLLELGPGSLTRRYIGKVKFPGQTSGSEEGERFGVSQSLIETMDGVDHWPYYGNLVEVSARKNDQGVSVITHMELKGSFYPANERTFKSGSRKEVKVMISALCNVMGSPQIQARKEQISEMRYVTSDYLVWSTQDATIWLYFQKHISSANLNFVFEIADSSTRDKMKIDKARNWDPDSKPLPPDFAKQFDAFCDNAKFDMGKQ